MRLDVVATSLAHAVFIVLELWVQKYEITLEVPNLKQGKSQLS